MIYNINPAINNWDVILNQSYKWYKMQNSHVFSTKWISSTFIFWQWISKDDFCHHQYLLYNLTFFKPYKVPFNIGKVVFWYTYRYQQYWACLHLSQENYVTWFKFMYKWANIRICLSLFSLVDTQFESQFKTKCLYCWKVIVFRIT